MSNQIRNSNLVAIEAALSFPERAHVLKITDETTFSAANDFLAADKLMQKLVHAAFDPTVEATKEAHNMALAQRDHYLNPLLTAEAIVKSKIGAWLVEAVRLRREMEQKAKQEAAEVERKRLAEMQAAIDAENAGKIEEAEKHFEEALTIEVPKMVIPEPVKAQGTFLRKDLKWRVINPTAVPREFLMLDHAKIEAVFRRERERMSIPGIQVYTETTVVSRS